MIAYNDSLKAGSDDYRELTSTVRGLRAVVRWIIGFGLLIQLGKQITETTWDLICSYLPCAYLHQCHSKKIKMLQPSGVSQCLD